MILQNEDQLRDPAIRKKIIEAIGSSENKNRKAEAYKRYQCYKDQTHFYVRNLLIRQFDANTVNEMAYALSNLSFLRKVIDKKARVYSYGVEREMEGSDISVLEKEADINNAMKKTNRFLELSKNCALYIRPQPTDIEGEQVVKVTPLVPYLYDVVEIAGERERALCYILSDYSPEMGRAQAVRPNSDGRTSSPMGLVPPISDGIDQIIADSPADQKTGQFVFWSNSYHFVCDDRGQIIGGPNDQLNPIGEKPFVNFAKDQDGTFWAQGGDDLVDGGILINSMITNVNHIAITQGYGQLVVTGKDLPQTYKVGPNKAVRLTYEEGDPVPTFEFKNSNPPLDQLRSLVEMYVALLLTTNNLSTSGVQSNLNGTIAFPSGVAMMIDKAESMDDVNDQRQIFIDNEPHMWRIYAKWHSLLKSRGELSEALSSLNIDESGDLIIKFTSPKPIETERERLEVLGMKKDLNLITMLDMLKAEYPDMNDEQVAEKLKEILEEKMEAAVGNQGQQNNEQSDDSANRPGGDIDGDQRRDRGVPSGADPSQGGVENESGDGREVPEAQ